MEVHKADMYIYVYIYICILGFLVRAVLIETGVEVQFFEVLWASNQGFQMRPRIAGWSVTQRLHVALGYT